MTVAANKNITVLIKRLNHGGAEKVCVTLCNELTHRHYNVELWILEPGDTFLFRQLNKKVKVTDLNKKHVKNSIFPLIKLFLRHKPKLTIVFNLELAILAIVFKKMFFLKTKIIVRSINTISLAYKSSTNKWKKFFTFRMIKYLLPYSNKIIAQSQGMQEDLIKNLHIKSNKIATIHNPAFSLSLNDLPKNNREEIPNEFLYIGRLQPQKGLENLIRIFNNARKINSTIHLTIVGEGPEKRKLEKISESLGLNSDITFTGYQPDTTPLFKKAKATVLTSLYEGFPNVLVESIAIGTPVIAFDCPSGPKDIIVQGVNGILVPNLDFEAFSKALLSVASNEIQFNKADVIETAKRFSLNTIINKYEEVFNETEL